MDNRGIFLIAILGVALGFTGTVLPKVNPSIANHARFALQYGSTNTTSIQSVAPGKTIVQTYIDIPTGQTLYIYYEAGFAASCVSGTNVCYLEIKGTVISLNSCKLDLSGGSPVEMGQADSANPICQYGPTSDPVLNTLVQFDAHNGDSTNRIVSGIFLISIF